MDLRGIVTGYLQLSEAGMIIAATQLSKTTKPPTPGHIRREFITPTELRETMQSGNISALWRSNSELAEALHYAQRREAAAAVNRAKIAAVSADALKFIDELRAEGMNPRLLGMTDANGNPIKLN